MPSTGISTRTTSGARACVLADTGSLAAKGKVALVQTVRATLVPSTRTWNTARWSLSVANTATDNSGMNVFPTSKHRIIELIKRMNHCKSLDAIFNGLNTSMIQLSQSLVSVSCRRTSSDPEWAPAWPGPSAPGHWGKCGAPCTGPSIRNCSSGVALAPEKIAQDRNIA